MTTAPGLEACYLKVTFPREVEVTTLGVVGGGLMRDATGGSAPTIVAQDLSNPLNQYVIVQGCMWDTDVT